MPRTRTIEIRLTVTVPEDHPGYNDPEWVADAAWGALSNEYGLVTSYSITDPDGPAGDDPSNRLRGVD